MRLARVTIIALVGLAAIVPARSVAQDDPNDVPLGDVARNMRKKTPPSQDVIDNDNFSRVMDQAEGRHAPGASLKFTMAGESRGFRVSAPDVTCSLSFSASTKSLLANQYAQMDLPLWDIPKLKGPATIEGDALTVSVMNGTDWHLSEVDVALMIVHKNPPADSSVSLGHPSELPETGSLAGSEVRPEKKPDATAIYRMRAPGPPFSRTVFSAPLNLELASGDEWHWAIVGAKGYPPQVSTESQQTAAQTSPTIAAPPAVVPASLLQENPAAASLSQDPQ